MTNIRPVVLGPGLNSCCIHLALSYNEPTAVGDILRCATCTSRMVVDPDGYWRWLRPAPHQFFGSKWDDYCKMVGCNAADYDSIHELNDRDLDELIVARVRQTYRHYDWDGPNRDSELDELVRRTARATRRQERTEYRRGRSRMSYSPREKALWSG